MKFQELYTLVNEISQNVISNTLQKNQQLKYNNPVTITRSNNFEKKVVDRAKDRGRYFQLHSYFNNEKVIEVIVKNAKLDIEKVEESDGSIKETKKVIMNVDYNNYGKWENARLIVYLPTKSVPVSNLYFTTDMYDLDPVFDRKAERCVLKNSTDAQQLRKRIMSETDFDVPWKTFKFL